MMKIFFVLISIGVIIIGLILFGRAKNEIDTLRNGKKVNVTITYMPVYSYSKDIYYNFKFKYKGKEYTKRLRDLNYTKLKMGDELSLVYNEEKHIFLFEDEKPTKQIISAAILFILGFFGVYYGKKY